MFYREAGIFKTSYASDQALFRIPLDRWFVIAVVVAAFVVVPLIGNEYWLGSIMIRELSGLRARRALVPAEERPRRAATGRRFADEQVHRARSRGVEDRGLHQLLGGELQFGRACEEARERRPERDLAAAGDDAHVDR